MFFVIIILPIIIVVNFNITIINNVYKSIDFSYGLISLELVLNLINYLFKIKGIKCK